jgi:hypothetical protein
MDLWACESFSNSTLAQLRSSFGLELGPQPGMKPRILAVIKTMRLYSDETAMIFWVTLRGLIASATRVR